MSAPHLLGDDAVAKLPRLAGQGVVIAPFSEPTEEVVFEDWELYQNINADVSTLPPALDDLPLREPFRVIVGTHDDGWITSKLTLSGPAANCYLPDADEDIAAARPEVPFSTSRGDSPVWSQKARG